MKLYFSPGACSLSPHIVLLEAGLAFQTSQVDLQKKLVAGGADFLPINPKGYVPALELDNGAVLTEVPVIVQYIADLAPDTKLAPPAGSLARYQVMEWLNFISTELQQNFGPLFAPAASEDIKAAARARLSGRYTYVAQRLEGRDYLAGANFTVADAYLFTVTNWAGFLNFDLAPWPALQAYQGRVAARPAVRQAMRDEGLIS